MKKLFLKIVPLLLVAFIFSGNKPQPKVERSFALRTENSRSFYMGFSSFASDMEVKAIQRGHELSNKNSDIRSVQLDAGVPWVEMDQKKSVPKRILDDWSYTKSQCGKKKILISITSRDFEGTHLALYANEHGNNQPLPSDWAHLAQNDLKVKQAYLRYARAVIDFWQPDYLAINVEANIIANKSMEVWQQYLDLHRYIYEALKKDHPKLLIFASIQVEHFRGLMADATGKASLQKEILGQLNPYQDMLALSVYPYSAQGEFTDDYFDDFKVYKKPIAISETGWPAESFMMFGYPTAGSQEAQSTYLQNILHAANQNKFIFVINWVSVDYIKLLEKLPKNDAMEFSKSWAYNGLWDKDFNSKKALQVWQSYYQMKRHEEV